MLAIRGGDDLVEVFDNWGGAPGAKLVADGGQPVTREHRLLSWAGEMEAQLVSQRQDLRRAHMELAAAREEAREARLEAQQLRSMLAAANEVRVCVVCVCVCVCVSVEGGPSAQGLRVSPGLLLARQAVPAPGAGDGVELLRVQLTP